MRIDFVKTMGEMLRSRRRERGLSQPDLAYRLGRTRSRVTELELDLINGRIGRDRLGLLVEACDALDLTIILAPSDRAQAVQHLLSGGTSQPIAPHSGRAFDDVFVDLAEDDEEDV